jgi:hypothetical protein
MAHHISGASYLTPSGTAVSLQGKSSSSVTLSGQAGGAGVFEDIEVGLDLFIEDDAPSSISAGAATSSSSISAGAAISTAVPAAPPSRVPSDVSVYNLPRVRSATLCVDTPRNLSLLSLSLQPARPPTPLLLPTAPSPSPSPLALVVVHDLTLAPAPTAIPPSSFSLARPMRRASADLGSQTNLHLLTPTPTSSSSTSSSGAAPPPKLFTYQHNPLYITLVGQPSSASASAAPAPAGPHAFTRDHFSSSSSSSSSSGRPPLPSPAPSPSPRLSLNPLRRALDLPVHGSRYDRCALCLEYGNVSKATCCALPRHAKCEMAFWARHQHRLALRPDGLVSVPCSTCKQEWRALKQDDAGLLRMVADLELGAEEGAVAARAARASFWREVLRDVASLQSGRAARRFVLALLVSSPVAFGGALMIGGSGVLQGRPLVVVLVVVAAVVLACAALALSAVLRISATRRVIRELDEEEGNAAAGAGGASSTLLPPWAEVVRARRDAKRKAAAMLAAAKPMPGVATKA